MSRTFHQRKPEIHRGNFRTQICGQSRKAGFRSHTAALLRAEEIIAADPTAKLARAYKCKACALWHLTSSPI
jgi:hypothetical protein